MGALPADALISTATRQALQDAAPQVAVPDDVLALLLAARQQAQATQQTVSDRRWRQLVGLLQLQAASRGAAAVGPWDLWLLPFVLAGAAELVVDAHVVRLVLVLRHAGPAEDHAAAVVVALGAGDVRVVEHELGVLMPRPSQRSATNRADKWSVSPHHAPS